MSDLWIGAGTALWLGILTSLSPCPLTTNIAAVSYLGKTVGNTRMVLLSGLAFVVGKIAAYLGLTLLLVTSLLTIPGAAAFLQEHLNKAIGPLLLLTGLVLLELIPLRFPSLGNIERFKVLAGKGSILGAGLLGLLFSLAFCPVSAALYFGSLLPLTLRQNAPVLYPLLYGVGTALPVLAFAILLAVAAHLVGAAFRNLAAFDKWARRITGAVFILAGIRQVLAYYFGLVLW